MIFDLVLNAGRVIDPLTALDCKASVGISGDKIAVITTETIEGVTELDCTGKIVSPGFIDIHSHVDNYLYSGNCYALQGITTAIGGNCGLSPLYPDHFFSQMIASGFPINQGQLAGHSFTMREEAGILDINAPASKEQLALIIKVAEKRLQEGALGISFGLEYAPGSSCEEIKALFTLAASHERPVAVHTRHDSWKGLEAIIEVLDISRQTGASLLISHLVYMVGMGMMTEALTLLRKPYQKACLSQWTAVFTALLPHLSVPLFLPRGV